ncbi:MAG: hypothetical protein EOR46_24910 [Mesorhizobium sp.]|nr:MAG: hypothetical protein EOR46_24910 [Mesorhizobium sp.]RWK67852.1 MAG: hypothetical protein EOR54_16640 [Mesorhizobium sp.]RWK76971.1 MAG: hypothetical protein EOR50_12465 [Mesorhizobium sp.]RWK80844.1 MAG: hypothetical protein EOR51_17505 [Mesorhizobium sp.]RWL07997.1 MAG: hypothetical protein EOR55_05205 [Mesorhizobium sp.]
MGGDWMSFLLSPISNVEKLATGSKLPISPLVGKMSGRTEGGATECKANRDHAHQMLITRPAACRNRPSASESCLPRW